MTAQYFDITQNSAGWHSAFAFQVFHLLPDDWQKMRWGFNAGALLEEALDRSRLFIEAQSVNEMQYFDKEQPIRILVLRGVNIPGEGVRMILMGKITFPSQKPRMEQAGQDYARKISSIFPHDFILAPAKTQDEYYQLARMDLLEQKPQIAAIKRGRVQIPPMRPYQSFRGIWQASLRSNEQIWRALSNMSQNVMLNILIQPSCLFEKDKERLLHVQNSVIESEKKDDTLLPYHAWLEEYVKRRISPWTKFFQVQIHTLFSETIDENLLRAIGSASTRDSATLPLPGFEITRPASDAERDKWVENIKALSLSHSNEMDDIADLEETFSVFRFPLRHEFGLPGVNFIAPSDVAG
ncbi:MAG: hypothetical protein Q8L87_02385 [Anaerolineales bacterium]|nr:hypothetical protein [Anaerolineales bacterium]